MALTSIADEVKRGNSVTYFTVGVSMRPLLTERQTHVTIVPLESAENGDLLLYVRKDGRQVLHRCIKQDESFYYMRGDNTYALEKIEKGQAVGIVTHIFRKGKRFNVKESKGYRAYNTLWQSLYPVRLALFKMRSALRRSKNGRANSQKDT